MQRLKYAGQKILEYPFKPAETRLAKWATAIILGLYFVAGILHWGFFLNWGKIDFSLGDWHKCVAPFLVFLTNALRSGQLPLHGDNPLFDQGRYLGYPNGPISPQILLLYLLSPAEYVLANIWIFYTVGFIGLLLIRTRYHLSLVPFTVLFLLINFNGHITAHYVVGHMEWAGYFLLPYFVLLMLKMVEGERTGWGWVFSIAAIMLVLNLEGAVHFPIWCMAFMILLALFQPHYWMPVIKAVIASLLISMIRILPPAIEYYQSSGIMFIYGFFSVSHMIESFIVLQPPYLLDTPHTQIGGWEVDYYLGLVGFTFMVYFGIVKAWMNEKRYRALYLPMLVMAFFSLGDMYRPLFNSSLPFMDSQRAPTRFLLVPVVFLIILAAIQFQNWIKDWDTWQWMEKIVVLFGLAFIGHDLIDHSRYWRYTNLTTKVIEGFKDVVQVPVINHSDSPYIIAIITGLVISTATFIVLIVLTCRESKKARMYSTPTK
jgi:hypothetical protein